MRFAQATDAMRSETLGPRDVRGIPHWPYSIRGVWLMGDTYEGEVWHAATRSLLHKYYAQLMLVPFERPQYHAIEVRLYNGQLVRIRRK